jgi:hypothetical protein
MEEDCRQGILLAEQFVEGKTTPEEVRRVAEALDSTRRATEPDVIRVQCLVAAHRLLSTTETSLTQPDTYLVEPSVPAEWRIAGNPAEWLREIVGNPFRPVHIDHAWRTQVVLNLAAAIYSGRTFEDMPILADALEDAGCDNKAILSHCREETNHLRGCWLLDLLLIEAHPIEQIHGLTLAPGNKVVVLDGLADPRKKISLIKTVREITGCGLVVAKALVENAPRMLVVDVNDEQVERYRKRIENAGGSVGVWDTIPPLPIAW